MGGKSNFCFIHSKRCTFYYNMHFFTEAINITMYKYIIVEDKMRKQFEIINTGREEDIKLNTFVLH